jgi:hypothetical protein
VPQIIKGSGGGLYGGGFTGQVGFPAAEGCYVALTSPHLEVAKIEAWQARHQQRWGLPPSDYSVTAHDAALVILDAVRLPASRSKGTRCRMLSRQPTRTRRKATSSSTRMAISWIARLHLPGEARSGLPAGRCDPPIQIYRGMRHRVDVPRIAAGRPRSNQRRDQECDCPPRVTKGLTQTAANPRHERKLVQGSRFRTAPTSPLCAPTRHSVRRK